MAAIFRQRGRRGLHAGDADHHLRDPAELGNGERGGHTSRSEPGSEKPDRAEQSVWRAGFYNMVVPGIRGGGLHRVRRTAGLDLHRRIPAVVSVAVQRAALYQLRLRVLRLGHGDRAGVQRRGRHSHAHRSSTCAAIGRGRFRWRGSWRFAWIWAPTVCFWRSQSPNRPWPSPAC